MIFRLKSKYLFQKRLFLVFLIMIGIVTSVTRVYSIKRQSPLKYYELEFKKKPPHVLADTLFEKTIWHKKVSYLVLEDKGDKFHVTLLMIMPYPHNYKSQNYPLYYEYLNYEEAFKKFVWLDKLLRKNGVLRVHILGSKITKEKVLYPGDSNP